MTTLETALRRINSDPSQARVPFAVVGGLAVSVRTEPRFTRDADLAVALSTDAEAEALIHTLRACHYGVEAVIEQEAAFDWLNGWSGRRRGTQHLVAIRFERTTC